MPEYIVDFESVNIEASDIDEAFDKARQLISAGEVEIDMVSEN